jgi:DNA-binding protein HU-beta
LGAATAALPSQASNTVRLVSFVGTVCIKQIIFDRFFIWNRASRSTLPQIRPPISGNVVILARSAKGRRHEQADVESALIQEIAEEHSGKLTRNDVKGVLASLTNVGYREIKRTGAFVVPGFAKFVVIKKAATKAHKGINPFTKEPITFKAKPARKIIKARPVKAAKDAAA